MSILLKNTLNLPKTLFPMRANASIRELDYLSHWKESDLSKRILEKNKLNEKYILHDGPPFTNGDVHIGTASNKILKDIIVRYKSMCGYNVPFYPGWDCHGLPIEHKVAVRLKSQNISRIAPMEIRKKCTNFSSFYKSVMRKQFDRLGILVNWSKEYSTMDSRYEAEVLRIFANFVELGLVYRNKKPVYWSIPFSSSLAEGEVEYIKKNSMSIWVKFDVVKSANIILPKNTSIVVWTTTPWTIPGNRAIAVNPEIMYVLLKNNYVNYIVAESVVENFIDVNNIIEHSIMLKIKGKELEYIEIKHPFIDRVGLVILSNHVTVDCGTGCVHIAPGHGLEDYFASKNYNIDSYCPVSNKGYYLNNGGMPFDLIDCSILNNKNKKLADIEVINMIKNRDKLLCVRMEEHQYPHCWRSKTPIIHRAIDQWFIDLDKMNLRNKMKEIINSVIWIPGWGAKRMFDSIAVRSDWCIGRQRFWGTPLPVFYDNNGNVLIDTIVINGIAERIQEEGSNLWFNSSSKKLLSSIKIPFSWLGRYVKAGRETIDVWLDSGSSHGAVLDNEINLNWPADLYCEGSDQHRGWFQSSLWTSLVRWKNPAYRKVITHGFIVNEQGKKLSKSQSSISKSVEYYTNKYGVDILRLWIASENHQSDITFSDTIIQQNVKTYRNIRNTLRFQLGNIYDFNYKSHSVNQIKITPIDQWALKKTDLLILEATKNYELFKFHKVCQLTNQFCVNILSSIYHDILKDRLYTNAPFWQIRRSSQTTIHFIFNILVRILSPIIPFTSDEAFSFSQRSNKITQTSIHLKKWPKLISHLYSDTIVKEVEYILDVKKTINEKMEVIRRSKKIGQSLDTKIIITGNSDSYTFNLLKKFHKQLSELFIVSQVEIKSVDQCGVGVKVVRACGRRCPRSWRWTLKFVYTKKYGYISEICSSALLGKWF